MNNPGAQDPNQFAGQNPGQFPGPYPGQQGPPPAGPYPAQAACAYRSDAHWLMPLGVVLLCFGQAITGRHEVTMIGLAMIVLSGFFW